MYIVPFNQLINPFRYLIFLTILFSTGFSQAQTNARTWEEEAGTNIRLLPAYGYVSKTPEMIRADDEFIRRTMERQKFEGSRRKASEEMVSIGFRYLNENNVKVAMYRFNQAFLLDSTNSNLYRGFGAVYVYLQLYEKALAQYEKGIQQQADNPLLWRDYGRCFLQQAITSGHVRVNDLQYINRAIEYLQKSASLNAKDAETWAQLAMSYILKQDCNKAKEMITAYKQHSTIALPEPIVRELNRNCPLD